MDICDEASKAESDYVSFAVAAIPRYAGESRRFCINCEDEIPERRRMAIKGVQLCIDCQTEIDNGRNRI